MPTDRRAPTPGPRKGWPVAWRLPLSISGLIVIALAVFLWTAFRHVERTLFDAGIARARGATAQLVNLFERSSRQTRADLQRLAADPAMARYLAHADDANREAVERLLTVSGTSARRVEVWNATGVRLLEISRPAAASGTPASRSIPPATWPISPGLSPFQNANGLIFFDNVEPIPGPSSAQTPAGYLVIRGTLVVNPPGALGQLVGADARVLIGNAEGGVWTDFHGEVPPPPIGRVVDSIADYDSSDSGRRLAAMIAVRDTPWAVWVEFSRDAITAPAMTFLRRMILIGLLVVAVCATVVRAVTRRLTTPLESLTGAAEAIAAGDYGRRVPERTRRDELSRLADAFNAMAVHVQTSHQALESRVSERTSALHALLVSEARYRAIIEVALDCIVTIDVNGMVMEFNPAAERTFGYRRADAVGRELATLIIPPAYRDAHRNGLARFLTTGAGAVVNRLLDLPAMRADGSEFPAEIAITTIDTAGRERLFTGVVRDITTRKRAEAALVESERAFRSTFDEAPLGIAQLTADGRWLRVNRRVTGLLGYEAAELLDRKFTELFTSDGLPPDEDPWSVLSAAAAAPAAHERCGRRKDGQFVWVSLTVSALRDAAGAPMYFIVIMEDTTERRRLEEQLRQSQKMEAIGRLAGGIAHDFNNLLTAILGYAHLLAEELEPGDRRRGDVDEIVRAAERSAALTRQLLAFSRKQVLQPRLVNLNALVADTTVMLRRVIGEDIELVTKLAPDLHAVSADPTQVEQIVMNLAVNARDAMPAGGRLTIETRNVELDESSNIHPAVVAAGPYALLSVRDTGIGMDRETKRRLFEPFFTTKEQGRGTGLGLATVYGIVKQSEGYIWVYSEPQQGATFKVYLPAVIDAGALPANDSPIAPPAHGTETILLVEDERAVRVLTKVLLARAGYRVIDAEGPEQARELFNDHADQIDLLITDVVMPTSHGPALYELLAAIRPTLKVLFMSGYTDDEIVRAGRLEPGVNFIEKPFTASELAHKVRAVLDQ